MKFDSSLKVKEALSLFFSHYHFKDGGYNDKFFKIKIGKIFIPLPNISARVKVARLHDIHHVLTEYNADWKGEVEIGIWELRTGCGKYWVAWLLNSIAVCIGLILYSKSIKQAYRRALNSKTNIYHLNLSYEELIDMNIGELRNKIFM